MLRDEKLSLPNGWEALLERMMLTRPTGSASERVYICSPCRAETPDEASRNMKAARVYMFYTYIYLHVIPKAPHAYIPILLHDGYEDERSIALRFGAQMLEGCDRLFVCGYRLSEGMCAEIIKAAERSIPVQVFNRCTGNCVLGWSITALIPRIRNMRTVTCISRFHGARTSWPHTGMSPDEKHEYFIYSAQVRTGVVQIRSRIRQAF